MSINNELGEFQFHCFSILNIQIGVDENQNLLYLCTPKMTP